MARRLRLSAASTGLRDAAPTLRQLYVIYLFILATLCSQADGATGIWGNPTFSVPISNVTVTVGREAVLECAVNDLSSYKVAWLRVDTQTILTIHGHVITKNSRVSVTHRDQRIWYLHIREVRESDRGWYMCQINTEPMISQVAYVNVVVPPDILDHSTSSDQVVREGTSVTLNCAATGYPEPTMVWRKELSQPIILDNGEEVPVVEGGEFHLNRVTRQHMGAYLCIASNGVPPSVSKRIMLIVQFPPMIWIQNQLVGATDGQEITLECRSEAYPKSINYWMREGGNIITQGAKYEPHMDDNAYKVNMKLTIKAVTSADFGSYKCISKNSLGDTDGTIKLYRIPSTSPPLSITKATEILYPERNDPGNSLEEDFIEDRFHGSSKESLERKMSAESDHLPRNNPTSAKTMEKLGSRGALSTGLVPGFFVVVFILPSLLLS